MNDIKRWEIYWADLRPDTGSEQGGFRPVLVLSNNILNTYSPVVMIAPLTRLNKNAKDFPTDIKILQTNINIDRKAIDELKDQEHYYNPNSDSVLYLTQIRSISTERLIKKIGELNGNVKYNEIKEGIAQVFAFYGCDSCYAPMFIDQLKCGNPTCKKRHRVKCKGCSNVLSVSDKFCSACGKGV